MVAFKDPDMVLSNPVVNVESLREPIDIVWFFAEKVDDFSPIGSPTRPRKDVP